MQHLLIKYIEHDIWNELYSVTTVNPEQLNISILT